MRLTSNSLDSASASLQSILDSKEKKTNRECKQLPIRLEMSLDCLHKANAVLQEKVNWEQLTGLKAWQSRDRFFSQCCLEELIPVDLLPRGNRSDYISGHVKFTSPLFSKDLRKILLTNELNKYWLSV